MITSPLRTLCRWSFSQLARQKIILLSYMTPLTKFTFLNCNLNQLPTQKNITNISSTRLINFVTSLQKQSSIIRQIQAENYGFIDVLEIQNGGRSSAQSLKAHRQQIKQMGSQFEHLTQQIFGSIDEVHIIQWMQVCWKLQILDIAVWNRLLTVVISCFLKLDVSAQHTVIKLTHQFIKQKFMAYNHSWSKFIYRENLLVDLINFKAFFAIFFKSLTNPHQNPFKQTNFQLIISLVEKVGKVCVLNFIDMLRHYRANETSYLAVLEGKNLKTAIQFLKFYAIIGLSDQEKLLSIQSHIYQIWVKDTSTQLLKSSQSQYQQEEKCQQTLSILSAWNSLCHNNTKLYKDLLRPLICRQLQNSSNIKYFYNWLFNIVGCQLEDWQLIEHLANKIAHQFPLENKNIHIIHHYLSVKKNIKTLSNFACSQNSVTLGIIKNCQKIYSNCMTKQGKSLVTKSNEFYTDIRFEKEVGFQQNPAQQFWIKILEKAFNRLKEKYPKSKNQIYLNFEFCVFEMDALIILNNQPIAFQLIGTHYKLKTIDEKDDEKKIQGKKIIKYKIIEAYGIKLLQIDSTKMIERTINTLQEEQGGMKYLCERMMALLAE